MEENKQLHSFTYNPQYLDALEDLTEEEQWRATYVLCYYGVNGEFPSCATSLDKMFVKTNLKMIAGSINWQEKQGEKAKKGGRIAAISDEQILEAYVELYKKTGHKPSEKEVIEFCGGGVTRIGTRDAWKKRDQYLEECMKCMELNDTFHTNVSNETYKHTENCMKPVSYKPFDF